MRYDDIQNTRTAYSITAGLSTPSFAMQDQDSHTAARPLVHLRYTAHILVSRPRARTALPSLAFEIMALHTQERVRKVSPTAAPNATSPCSAVRAAHFRGCFRGTFRAAR